MQLHLVDGTYELFRAFYGAPSATGANGREVGAVRALIRSLLSLSREPGATHIACAFDTVIESWRNERFAGYKTGEGIDPALWSQFELAERATRALGLVTWSMIEFEADDALATAAARFVEDQRVEKVWICSPDKDLMQCVRGDRVVVLDRRRKKVIDEPGVSDKLGVTPKSVPDFLALVGDSADGLPGVPRWGAVSAGAVLRRFDSIERIPDDANDWPFTLRGKEALAASLAANRADAMLYKELATLRRDVPLAEDLDALRYTGPPDDAVLHALAAELDDPEIPVRAKRG